MKNVQPSIIFQAQSAHENDIAMIIIKQIYVVPLIRVVVSLLQKQVRYMMGVSSDTKTKYAVKPKCKKSIMLYIFYHSTPLSKPRYAIHVF